MRLRVCLHRPGFQCHLWVRKGQAGVQGSVCRGPDPRPTSALSAGADTAAVGFPLFSLFLFAIDKKEVGNTNIIMISCRASGQPGSRPAFLGHCSGQWGVLCSTGGSPSPLGAVGGVGRGSRAGAGPGPATGAACLGLCAWGPVPGALCLGPCAWGRVIWVPVTQGSGPDSGLRAGVRICRQSGGSSGALERRRGGK